MNDSSIAVRYAKALYASAREFKLTEQVLADLKYIDKLIQETPEFSEFIQSPVVQVSDKLSILNDIFKNHCEELSFRFLELITRNKRESYLPAMIRKFFYLYRKDQGIISAKLTTVTKSQTDSLEKIKILLKQKYNAEVELEELNDQDLIGGFVLRVDDEQLDLSIASQLKKIRRELDQTIIQ
ncbi:MAG: ATP synthase F1 subunit delta [Bacteroidales bacterium]|nr:ATP synthase F1 subunit delta [Bacteroidales bacterium]